MSGPSISTKRLSRRIRDGAGGDEAELRQGLGLVPDADDRRLARELVRQVARRHIEEVTVSKEREVDCREAETPEVMGPADSSFLGRLSVDQGEGRPGVSALADVPTLLAVLRAGTLVQRRAAARRLAGLLSAGDLSNDEVRLVSTTLLNLRDVEISLEVSRARAGLGGAHGRQARQEADAFERMVEEVERAIDDFWAGESSDEPIAALPPDQRAQLMVRLRDAPDRVLFHVASVLDGSDGMTDDDARLALLGSLRYSADARLVPTLIGLMNTRGGALSVEAAKALGRTEDPRAHPALAAAFERSVIDWERATYAGALGKTGDVRGRDYVRQLFATDDDRVLLGAVEAAESLATSEDAERLIPLLQRTDPVLLQHTIRALARTGDARGLLTLAELRRQAGMSALFTEAEDAELTIRASMELRGEEGPEEATAIELASAQATGMAERERDPVVVRVTSWFDFVIGHVWLAIGAAKRATARFERAAGRRRGWAAPVAALAMHHARSERPAQALSAFRRALESDRGWMERNVFAMRALVRIFLRRAEEVERNGRVDIARGLVEEALALDLRRVPTELRFELSRRQQQLRSPL